MFEQVTLLLSFVYVIALTHLLSSVTDLLLARDRVKFSGVHALWMGTTLLALFNNWLQASGLRSVVHWTVAKEAWEFTGAIIQYFTCSLVSIRVEPGEAVDMDAFYLRERKVFMPAMGAAGVFWMIGNYLDGPGSSWILADLLNLPMLIGVIVGAVARARWLQWVAALATFGMAVGFLIAIPASG